MSRREYDLSIVFNEIEINKVIIDSHFEVKHARSINDQIILELVAQLNGLEMTPEDIKPPYSYFKDTLILNGKKYRLVWLTEEDKIYIGVINAFRK